MQKRIAACDKEIGEAIKAPGHIQAIFENKLHIPPIHAVGFRLFFTSIYIAMAATLIAFICYVPLKGKIRTYNSPSLEQLVKT